MRTFFPFDVARLPLWQILLTLLITLGLGEYFVDAPAAGLALADNTYLTISMITLEALSVLKNMLSFTKGVTRHYDASFGVEGAKIGTVLNVRKPPRFVGRSGQQMQIEDATDTSVPVALNTQFGVDFVMSSSDLKLSIDQFSERYLKPAIATIANKVDYDGLQLYSQIANTVGTPGVLATDWGTYLDAGVKMDEEAAPNDGQRSIVYTPKMGRSIVNALKGLFNDGEQIKKQYRQGRMDESGGFKWKVDQNVASHTVGALGGTPLVNGASQSGSSVITDAWTASAATRLKRGDVVQFAGTYAVNPQNRQSTGSLRDFVVTADTASDGSGNMTIPISPAIVLTGAFQNVSNAPANNAAVTIFGSASAYASVVTPQALAYHKDAFTLACADLPLPGGVDKAARMSDPDLGLSIRMIRDYTVTSDIFATRLDILYGWAVLRAELAARICG
ncbi:MAG: hypothetical protein NUW22_07525 [Acidobacteria bacterium]|nr:hypothetical protein [Acidobacteriota bacterium]